MKTIKFFKIAENSKKFDTVKLMYDELDKEYIVQWKWTTMHTTELKIYKIYANAKEKYIERKNFAKLCN